MASKRFGSDRVLLYNVDPWKQLGFGCPNFGDNIGTLSIAIANMVDEIGVGQLYIMNHVDATRKQPPSINTVIRICKICNRVNAVLSGRAKKYSDVRVETGHDSPAPEVWTIHPVPYFNGPIVRNYWLKEYNRLCMIALTNMMQHSDNNLPLTMTDKFATDIWQYFNEVKLLIGRELLQVPAIDLAKPDFVFLDSHYKLYAPDAITLNVEGLDTPGPVFSLPTEDDLRPLFNGIPANIIIPNLSQYPVTTDFDLSGVQIDVDSGTVGADSATAKPVLGGPQI